VSWSQPQREHAHWRHCLHCFLHWPPRLHVG